MSGQNSGGSDTAIRCELEFSASGSQWRSVVDSEWVSDRVAENRLTACWCRSPGSRSVRSWFQLLVKSCSVRNVESCTSHQSILKRHSVRDTTSRLIFMRSKGVASLKRRGSWWDLRQLSASQDNTWRSRLAVCPWSSETSMASVWRCETCVLIGTVSWSRQQRDKARNSSVLSTAGSMAPMAGREKFRQR